MEAQVVQAAMDGVGRSMQVASELAARNQADAFSEVPVLEFAPRLLAAADIDARCCPGLPEGVEVPQDGIQRRIRSPGTGTTTVLTMLPVSWCHSSVEVGERPWSWKKRRSPAKTRSRVHHVRAAVRRVRRGSTTGDDSAGAGGWWHDVQLAGKKTPGPA
jgi:hypothetical protein